MKLKKILAAVDGSEASFKALDYAVSLAKCYAASLTITTVVEPPSPAPSPTIPPAVLKSYRDEMRASQKRVLDDALQRVSGEKKGLDIQTTLLYGRAAVMIVRECRDGGYDLLVMGSRGLGGIKELFLGSVSKRVVEDAPCPVLIVKSGGEK
jgi:nucleotide-binding universal stress UspA family protein